MSNKMNYSQDIIDRFWRKVKPPENENDCWEWTAGLQTRGYGSFTVFPQYKERSHRFSWEFFNGPIPKDLHVLHKCDNRKCVNPDHLFLGNQQDNTKDMLDKNRQAVGSRINCATITEESVEELLEGIKNKKYTSRKQICNTFSILDDTLDYILRREGWLHVTQKYSKQELDNMRRSINKTFKLSPDEILEIKQDLKNGHMISYIMKKFNISRGTVNHYR